MIILYTQVTICTSAKETLEKIKVLHMTPFL